MGALIPCKDGRALEAVPVSDFIAVQVMRQIRNVCREGFSNDHSEISPAAQTEWWDSIKGRAVAFLYSEPFGAWVGYGLLRPDADGRTVSSVAVLPEYAGRGYGGAITRHIVRQASGTVYATARLDNPAAMALHNADDWVETGRAGDLAFYRTREALV